MNKNNIDKIINKSFDAESKEDLAKYFSFLAKEIENILGKCEAKKEALATLERFMKGEIDSEEVRQMLPTKEKAKASYDKIQAQLGELKKDYKVIETLMNSVMNEVKSRVENLS